MPYMRVYEQDAAWRQNKRVGLTFLAAEVEHDECLRVMAEAFESPRAVFMNHIYWGDLDLGSTEDSPGKKKSDRNVKGPAKCVVL